MTDALADLLRGAAGGPVARLMQLVAPTWYSQAAPAASAPAAGGSRAASQPAMLREFCDLLREASRLGPVILFFDDVHWADSSTVDLLAYLAGSIRTLPVLVVVSYRSTELLLATHPFHRVRLDLLGKGTGAELTLGLLGRADIDHTLRWPFPVTRPAIPGPGPRRMGQPAVMVELLRYRAARPRRGRWPVGLRGPRLELPDRSAA